MQYSRNKNKRQITILDCFRHGQWPVLILSPAICFVTTVMRLRKGDIKASWAIPFIMGMFAYLFPPFADFARAENQISELINLPLSEIILLRGDIVVTSCEYFFLKYHIPIEIFRFLYTFVVYYFYTKIFIDITRESSFKKKKIFYIWLFLFMQISFFAFIDNIRTIFVRLMLGYCMYQYFFKSINKYRYYSLLLGFVHFAYFPILFVFFLSKYIKIELHRYLRLCLIILLIIGAFFLDGIDVTNYLTGFNFGDAINNKIEAYTEGEWSADGDSFNNKSLAFKIYNLLASLSLYYLVYLYCKVKYKFNLEHFSSPLILLCILTISIPVLFGRYVGFLYLALGFFVLYGYIHGYIKEMQMKMYLILSIFTTLLNIYAYWNCLVNGNVIYMFLPLPFALLQTYDFNDWRIKHLDEDFNKIIKGGFLSR